MNQEVKKDETVPFNQLRLLILSMEAAKKNNQARIEQIREEAALCGISISYEEKSVLKFQTEKGGGLYEGNNNDGRK